MRGSEAREGARIETDVAARPAYVAGAPGLAPLCRALTVSGSEAGLLPIDAGVFLRALNLFGRNYRQPERRALASLWSMHYLQAVVVPAAAAVLTLDHALPLALGSCRLRLDADGTPAEVRLGGAAGGDPLAALLEGHIVPFVALYGGVTGLAPRLLWSNAAVILAFTLDRVAGAALSGPRAAVAALLEGRHPFPHLAGAVRETEMCERERLLCCGRRRLSGVAPCYTLCPERDVW